MLIKESRGSYSLNSKMGHDRHSSWCGEGDELGQLALIPPSAWRTKLSKVVLMLQSEAHLKTEAHQWPRPIYIHKVHSLIVAALIWGRGLLNSRGKPHQLPTLITWTVQSWIQTAQDHQTLKEKTNNIKRAKMFKKKTEKLTQQETKIIQETEFKKK